MLALVDCELPRVRCRTVAAKNMTPPRQPQAGRPQAVRRPPLGWRLRQLFMLLCNGSLFVPLYAWSARKLGLVVAYTELRGRMLHEDGTITDYGLLSRRIVTTAGVNYLAGCFDGTNSVTVFKYAGFGTGTTAAAIGDTALQTETTAYAVASTRPTGSQAHSTNTYTTVATFSPPGGNGTLAITEFGLFSQAATGGGTLLDHIVFSAVNLVSGSDSLQSTFVLTLPSGG